MSKTAIQRRSSQGRLHRIHRGVYAVGHAALSQQGRWMAAVLSLGDKAALSHRSAAALWKLLPDSRGSIEVSVPGNGGRSRRQGVRLHRSPSLNASDTTRREGIPVTTPARTIADLRRVAPALAARALRQAAVVGLHLPEEVAADHTRSELESRFLNLCRRHRLPPPEVNVPVGPYTVDFLWREKRLIVETDGYRYHRGRQAFEDDRARDMQLRLLGYEVLRVTYQQLMFQKASLVKALRSVLETPTR
jgi:very-short-patch-repair endonuclease